MIKWIGYNKYKSWFGKVLNMLLIKSIILNDYKKVTDRITLYLFYIKSFLLKTRSFSINSHKFIGGYILNYYANVFQSSFSSFPFSYASE